jgi:hypothetical protein
MIKNGQLFHSLFELAASAGTHSDNAAQILDAAGSRPRFTDAGTDYFDAGAAAIVRTAVAARRQQAPAAPTSYTMELVGEAELIPDPTPATKFSHTLIAVPPDYQGGGNV